MLCNHRAFRRVTHAHARAADSTAAVRVLAITQILLVVPMPDGGTLLATGSDDATVRLWDPVTGTARGVLTGHTGAVRAMAAVPMLNGSTLMVTAGDDRAVIIWEPLGSA